MAISFNTGAHVTSAGAQVASQNITVPAGVLAGDVVLVFAAAVNVTSTTTPTLTASSTGTTPTQAGTTAGGSEPLPAAVAGAVFYFVATGTDAGKVITISTSINSFMALALAAYTGASNSAPIDVSGGAFGGANTASVTCPVKTTVTSGDWSVFLGGGAAEGSANNPMGIPAGSTARENNVDSSAIGAAITDSAASVGAGGTSIGGGTFTCGSPTNAILAGFTVGLAPASSGPVANPVTLALAPMASAAAGTAGAVAQAGTSLALAPLGVAVAGLAAGNVTATATLALAPLALAGAGQSPWSTAASGSDRHHHRPVGRGHGR